ncbi:MAG: TIM barrel protein [Draconibacterium sp.]|nr:TIM barrel protein [Draconibacterium sp.]
MKNSRRKFIQTSVLGAAVVGTGIPKIVSAKNPPSEKKKYPPLKLGLMTYTLGKDWDIETIIKNCSETGWVHAELRTTHAHGVEVSLSKKERAEVKKRFEDSPMEAISLASAFRYHENDPAKLKENIEGTKEYLQLAADVGALGIRVFPNAFVDGVDREKTMEQIGKALAEVGEFGHNLGVDVRVCVHGKGTDEIPVIKKILDYSGSEHVYVNWNCSENDVKGKGLKANFDAVKDKIRGIHMHELTSEYPYREFLKLLRESGYNGYCNAEINQSCEPIRLMQYYRTLFLAFQDEV